MIERTIDYQGLFLRRKIRDAGKLSRILHLPLTQTYCGLGNIIDILKRSHLWFSFSVGWVSAWQTSDCHPASLKMAACRSSLGWQHSMSTEVHFMCCCSGCDCCEEEQKQDGDYIYPQCCTAFINYLNIFTSLGVNDMTRICFIRLWMY